MSNYEKINNINYFNKNVNKEIVIFIFILSPKSIHIWKIYLFICHTKNTVMFYDLIKKTSDKWLQSEECKIKSIVEYIEKN